MVIKRVYYKTVISSRHYIFNFQSNYIYSTNSRVYVLFHCHQFVNLHTNFTNFPLIIMSIPRNYSDKFVTGKSDVDLLMNKNADWVNFPFISVIYVAGIGILWMILQSLQVFNAGESWTVVNTIHGVVNSYFFIRLFITPL